MRLCLQNSVYVYYSFGTWPLVHIWSVRAVYLKNCNLRLSYFFPESYPSSLTCSFAPASITMRERSTETGTNWFCKMICEAWSRWGVGPPRWSGSVGEHHPPEQTDGRAFLWRHTNTPQASPTCNTTSHSSPSVANKDHRDKTWFQETTQQNDEFHKFK